MAQSADPKIYWDADNCKAITYKQWRRKQQRKTLIRVFRQNAYEWTIIAAFSLWALTILLRYLYD